MTGPLGNYTLTSHRRTVELETVDEQQAAGRYSPGLVIHFHAPHHGEQRHYIGAGTDDSVLLYRERPAPARYWVLTVNRRLEYAGLTLLEYSERDGQIEEIGEVFLQSEDDIAQCFGRRRLDYEDHTLCRMMIDTYGELF